MEHISNEQKANEIANAFFIENVSAENEQVIQEMLNKASFEAMQWKDEKFKKVLDYAENCYGVFSFEQRENFINHIKEIFYGKE